MKRLIGLSITDAAAAERLNREALVDIEYVLRAGASMGRPVREVAARLPVGASDAQIASLLHVLDGSDAPTGDRPMALPASTTSAIRRGVPSLWRSGDGTLTLSVHPLGSAEGLEGARVRLTMTF